MTKARAKSEKRKAKMIGGKKTYSLLTYSTTQYRDSTTFEELVSVFGAGRHVMFHLSYESLGATGRTIAVTSLLGILFNRD